MTHLPPGETAPARERPGRSPRRLAWLVTLIAVLVAASYFGFQTWARSLDGEPIEATANGLQVGPLTERTELRSLPTTVGTADAKDVWPNLFGPQHNSEAPDVERTPAPWPEDGPRELWRVPSGAGYSSPIVWGDTVIHCERVDDEELVIALALDDGQPRWEHRYRTDFVCGSHYTNGPYATPATDGELVFTLGASGQLHCLRLADGEVVWHRDLASEFQVATEIFGMGHSPLLWGDKLILNVGGAVPDSGVIAFDKRTGDIIWQATDDRFSYATPQPARIHDRDWLFVLTRSGLVLLDPETGSEQWTIPYLCKMPDAYAAVTPLVHGDVVMISILGTGTKAIRVLPDGKYEELWESKRNLTSQYTPLICVDGFVYGVHALDNSFRCVDLLSGELKWRWKSDLQNCKAIRVGSRLVLFGEYGHLGLIDLNPEQLVQHSLTAQSMLADDSRCYSAPALAGDRLLLRNESALVCVQLPPISPTGSLGSDSEVAAR
ncbi:MAG: PQQ-binding-like beta-propeller repeat protein [Planctomycetaceae bacterium]